VVAFFVQLTPEKTMSDPCSNSYEIIFIVVRMNNGKPEEEDRIKLGAWMSRMKQFLGVAPTASIIENGRCAVTELTYTLAV
jgi:hypothetical protein